MDKDNISQLLVKPIDWNKLLDPLRDARVVGYLFDIPIVEMDQLPSPGPGDIVFGDFGLYIRPVSKSGPYRT